ncbi:MAG: hypothetical protein ABIQ55_06010, partial [Gemmatimonadaceae bacterium]
MKDAIANGGGDHRIVCIAGMHRSGTSMTARLISLLGAYLGPDDALIPPAEDKPKGYWEYEPFVQLNDSSRVAQVFP